MISWTALTMAPAPIPYLSIKTCINTKEKLNKVFKCKKKQEKNNFNRDLKTTKTTFL